jgi:hypothetical protein
VREDYSGDGAAWDYFPHDHARSRAYRWGEDGIAGICDNHQRLCFALALWNGADPILKERMFGLTNGAGNHGEDVKEYYFYLDNAPTHAYMKYLYKYPQVAYPYADLVAENGRRKSNPWSFEYELLDTGVFQDNRYFDVFVEYAKSAPEDILIQVSVVNRGPALATLHLLPTLWFRNTWSWNPASPNVPKPMLRAGTPAQAGFGVVEATARDRNLGTRWLYCENPREILFTENDTNKERFGWGPNPSPYVKDAFDSYLIHGRADAVNPQRTGTKAAAYYKLDLAPSQTAVIRLRLSDVDMLSDPFGADFAGIVATRIEEAEAFYQAVSPFPLPDEMRRVQRQAFAGLLWGKQFYHYVIQDWLDGDLVGPRPPEQRKRGRNHEWVNLYNDDVLSMPDDWEFPWFAAWDLAFHTIPLALIDPEFAKRQLVLLGCEWYMHPAGQIPAYEWAFNDLNPPVEAWAAWRVYKIEERMCGQGDRLFLQRMFQRLMLYFTWWVNRNDIAGNNIFGGGFLGLDNIGVFDRSTIPAAVGGHIDQADGTSWMGMFCLNLLEMALELAKKEPVYADMAGKLFNHFLYIAEAMNGLGGTEVSLWDDTDSFYYDVLHLTGGQDQGEESYISMKVRSMVGLVPLFAVMKIDLDQLQSGDMEDFTRRFDWFMKNRPDLTRGAYIDVTDTNDQYLKGKKLSLVSQDKLRRILQKMLDETEFLGPYGIRSMSKYHERCPYVLPIASQYRVEYAPAESRTGDFGGNSNWRGPVWFPVNYLIIESLQRFHRYLGDAFKVEYPTGSGNQMTLWEVAAALSERLITIFLPDADGHRPVYGGTTTFQEDPNWQNLILFFEYFHGDNGAGLGASHQTGWTGIVAKLIQQWGEYAGQHHSPS